MEFFLWDAKNRVKTLGKQRSRPAEHPKSRHFGGIEHCVEAFTSNRREKEKSRKAQLARGIREKLEEDPCKNQPRESEASRTLEDLCNENHTGPGTSEK